MLGKHIDRRTNYFTSVTNHEECDDLKVKHYYTTKDVENVLFLFGLHAQVCFFLTVL